MLLLYQLLLPVFTFDGEYNNTYPSVIKIITALDENGAGNSGKLRIEAKNIFFINILFIGHHFY